jgi:glycosyltransferase involved in cell wall biosynthesis
MGAPARRARRENIRVITPPLIPLPDSIGIRRFNTTVLVRKVRNVLGELPPRPVQLWLFTPDAPELIGRFDEERVVYYCVDDFAEFPGYDRALVRRLERQTIAGSDVVIASAQKLFDDRRPMHPNVHLVPHGVDVDHFAAATRETLRVPADVADLPRPVFGFFGLIGRYVDLSLIAGVARRRPDWTFVLIGEATCDTSTVTRLANIRLLGRRCYDELPAYCRAFDAGLIPFVVNDLTRAVNPIKLREYLAAGLPVVSTPLPEVCRYHPHVRIGETADVFEQACEVALADARDVPAHERQALVREDGWPARVEQISRIVQTAVPLPSTA